MPFNKKGVATTSNALTQALGQKNFKGLYVIYSFAHSPATPIGSIGYVIHGDNRYLQSQF
jgi:hypothetical protein